MRPRRDGHHFQTTFTNTFSWTKIYKFRSIFHWCLFPRVQLTIFQHWFRQWLGAGQAPSHYLKQWWLVYWCIYASLGLNELSKCHKISQMDHGHNGIQLGYFMCREYMVWLLRESSLCCGDKVSFYEVGPAKVLSLQGSYGVGSWWPILLRKLTQLS